MQRRIARALTRLVEVIIGRRRLARGARFITNEVRRDAGNDMESNGERIVQGAALKAENPVVLDVGGHFGEWSTSLLDIGGNDPTVHVFEPSRVTAAKAQGNLRGRATVHVVGMSDRPGEGELHIVHEGAGSNSVVPFSSAERSAADTESIVLSTVDLFCEEHAIGRVALLKIDAEGHDLAVMRGASRALAAQQISLIQFEYNWRWIEARVFLRDAFDLLQTNGYEMGKVTPDGIETYDRWHYELESFREANYLAFLPSARGTFPTIPWWGG